MAYNKVLLQKRNTAIVVRYRDLKKKNPKWRWDAIIEQVAADFYISPSTVGRILSENQVANVPCADTVIKYTRPQSHLQAVGC